MRPFVAVASAIILAWGLYLASPYWAIWDFADALGSRDVERVSRRVNVRAVRLSLAKQLVAEGLQAKAVGAGRDTSEAQLAAGTIAAAADPFLEEIVTAAGIFPLLPDIRAGRSGGGAAAVLPSLRAAWSFVHASRWRGFRNVYVMLPPDAEPAEQFRLQFRLSRLSWRLVTVDVPAAVRGKLLGDMLRRRGVQPPQ